MNRKQIGFTLVELLVVISIIAILLAVLMPALRRARAQAQNIICRANVKQWGMMLSMYANANNGHFMPGFNMKQGMWMCKLRPYYSDMGKIRLCPKAPNYLSATGMSTNIFTAWGVYGTAAYKTWYPPNGIDGTPYFGEAGDYGSYGINNWIDDPPDVGDIGPTTDPSPTDRPNFWRTMYQKAPNNIPTFGDSVWEGTEAFATDVPPLRDPGVSKSAQRGMFNFCIPRHGLAINMAFMDNSARKVSIKEELWTLKWSKNFRTDMGKYITWPDWMRRDWGN